MLLVNRRRGRRWRLSAAVRLALAMIPAVPYRSGADRMGAAGLYGFATRGLLSGTLALPPALACSFHSPGLMADTFALGERREQGAQIGFREVDRRSL